MTISTTLKYMAVQQITNALLLMIHGVMKHTYQVTVHQKNLHNQTLNKEIQVVIHTVTLKT